MRLDKREFAKELRRNQTDAERKLWMLLRDRSLEGYKFRRQQQIGPYFADFCCLRPRLIVELDGGQHADQLDYDQRRTEFLNKEGFLVLRFWDNQVLKERDSVMEVIRTALIEMAPSPPPSPTLGRGRSMSGD